MQTLIRLSNVTKQYDGFPALAGISLEVGAGITGLLGPNGAGKTTLIKVLLGLVRASSGDGEVLGYRLPAHVSTGLWQWTRRAAEAKEREHG